MQRVAPALRKTPEQRKRVLALYKRCLTIGKRTWPGPHNERVYIQEEAKRKNALLEDPTEIDERIEEAETRIEIALHYKIPYPRLHYETRKVAGDQIQKLGKQKAPVYMKSYYE